MQAAQLINRQEGRQPPLEDGRCHACLACCSGAGGLLFHHRRMTLTAEKQLCAIPILRSFCLLFGLPRLHCYLTCPRSLALPLVTSVGSIERAPPLFPSIRRLSALSRLLVLITSGSLKRKKAPCLLAWPYPPPLPAYRSTPVRSRRAVCLLAEPPCRRTCTCTCYFACPACLPAWASFPPPTSPSALTFYLASQELLTSLLLFLSLSHFFLVSRLCTDILGLLCSTAATFCLRSSLFRGKKVFCTQATQVHTHTPKRGTSTVLTGTPKQKQGKKKSCLFGPFTRPVNALWSIGHTSITLHRGLPRPSLPN